jgi:hypothetical protein
VLWIRTHQHAGDTFNYSLHPARVSEWTGYGDQLNVTPLPANMRVLYRHVPTDDDAEYFKAFTVEEVNGMDMLADDIEYAEDWFLSSFGYHCGRYTRATVPTRIRAAGGGGGGGGAASHNRFMGIGYSSSSSRRRWQHHAPYLPGTKLAGQKWGWGFGDCIRH